MNVQSNGTVLIADDDAVVRHLLSSVLSTAGYQVHTVCSGAECLAFLNSAASQSCAIVFLDVQLGDMSGIDIIPTLRSSLNASCSIVLLSANSPEELLRDYPLAAEANELLAKPFEFERAVELCSAAIGRSSNEK